MSEPQREPHPPLDGANPYVAPLSDLSPTPASENLADVYDEVMLDVYRGRVLLIKTLAGLGMLLGGPGFLFGLYLTVAAITIFALRARRGGATFTDTVETITGDAFTLIFGVPL